MIKRSFEKLIFLFAAILAFSGCDVSVFTGTEEDYADNFGAVFNFYDSNPNENSEAKCFSKKYRYNYIIYDEEWSKTDSFEEISGASKSQLPGASWKEVQKLKPGYTLTGWYWFNPDDEKEIYPDGNDGYTYSADADNDYRIQYMFSFEDKVYNFYGKFTAGEASYSVRYYLQTLKSAESVLSDSDFTVSDDQYEADKTLDVSYTGTVDSTTDIETLVKLPEGYELADGGIRNVTILSDGSAIASVYCNRLVYTITFEPEGGTVNGSTENSEQKIPFGGTISEPEDYEKDNSIFTGWTVIDSSGIKTPYDEGTLSKITVTSDLTVRANWEKYETYTLTYCEYSTGAELSTLGIDTSSLSTEYNSSDSLTFKLPEFNGTAADSVYYGRSTDLTNAASVTSNGDGTFTIEKAKLSADTTLYVLWKFDEIYWDPSGENSSSTDSNNTGCSEDKPLKTIHNSIKYIQNVTSKIVLLSPDPSLENGSSSMNNLYTDYGITVAFNGNSTVLTSGLCKSTEAKYSLTGITFDFESNGISVPLLTTSGDAYSITVSNVTITNLKGSGDIPVIKMTGGSLSLSESSVYYVEYTVSGSSDSISLSGEMDISKLFLTNADSADKLITIDPTYTNASAPLSISCDSYTVGTVLFGAFADSYADSDALAEDFVLSNDAYYIDTAGSVQEVLVPSTYNLSFCEWYTCSSLSSLGISSDSLPSTHTNNADTEFTVPEVDSTWTLEGVYYDSDCKNAVTLEDDKTTFKIESSKFDSDAAETTESLYIKWNRSAVYLDPSNATGNAQDYNMGTKTKPVSWFSSYSRISNVTDNFVLLSPSTASHPVTGSSSYTLNLSIESDSTVLSKGIDGAVCTTAADSPASSGSLSYCNIDFENLTPTVSPFTTGVCDALTPDYTDLTFTYVKFENIPGTLPVIDMDSGKLTVNNSTIPSIKYTLEGVSDDSISLEGTVGISEISIVNASKASGLITVDSTYMNSSSPVEVTMDSYTAGQQLFSFKNTYSSDSAVAADFVLADSAYYIDTAGSVQKTGTAVSNTIPLPSSYVVSFAETAVSGTFAVSITDSDGTEVTPSSCETKLMLNETVLITSESAEISIPSALPAGTYTIYVVVTIGSYEYDYNLTYTRS